MGNIISPRGFLLYGGIILIVVGVLGFFGIIGPDSGSSIFGDFWWFDNAENIAHLVLGVVALVALYVFPGNLHKPLVLLVGAIGLLVGVYSLFFSEGGSAGFIGAMLQNPADTVLHLVVGVWGVWAGMKKPVMGGMAMPMQQ